MTTRTDYVVYRRWIKLTRAQVVKMLREAEKLYTTHVKEHKSEGVGCVLAASSKVNNYLAQRLASYGPCSHVPEQPAKPYLFDAGDLKRFRLEAYEVKEFLYNRFLGTFEF